MREEELPLTDRSAWEVPEFRAHDFFPPRSKYCICVFVLDEGSRFRRQLSLMQPYLKTIDLIIADGGSTDGSAEPAVALAAGARSLLVKTGPGRLSAQMRMALSHAMTSGYAGAITMDGNGKDDPSAIPDFAAALDQGFDHVQGSRYMPGGRAINTPPLRHYGVTWIHAPLISLAAGFRYTDTTNGFRAYSRRLLMDPRVAPFRNVFQAYELHYYLAIRAARLGFRCREIPVTREYPAGESAPTKIRGLRGNIAILKTVFRATRGTWNPRSSSV